MSRWKDVLGELVEVAPGVFQGAEPLDEVEHFYVCQDCGQAVDYRELGDVLYHDRPGHLPLMRQ